MENENKNFTNDPLNEEEMLEAAEKAYNEAVKKGEISVVSDMPEGDIAAKGELPDEAEAPKTSEAAGDGSAEETPSGIPSDSSEKSVRKSSEEKEKETMVSVSTDMTVICCASGLVLGAVIGFVISSIPLCIICGVVLGLVLGLILDTQKDKKNAESKNAVVKTAQPEENKENEDLKAFEENKESEQPDKSE